MPVSSPLQQIGAASAGAEKHAARQSAGTCEARFTGSSRIGRSVGAVSSKSGGLECWTRVEAARRRGGVRALAGEGSLQQSEKWGDGVSLGTALLPPDVDLGRLESLLFQVLPLSAFLLRHCECERNFVSVVNTVGLNLSPEFAS